MPSGNGRDHPLLPPEGYRSIVLLLSPVLLYSRRLLDHVSTVTCYPERLRVTNKIVSGSCPVDICHGTKLQ
jgi:hypothetical protein